MSTTQARSKPHDHFFKVWLEHIDTARSFLMTHLPSHVVFSYDFSTLQHHRNIFERFLGSGEADLLFSLKNHTTGKRAYILLEHKSYPAKYLAWQMTVYMLAIVHYHHQHFGKNTFPDVHAYTFYHGEQATLKPINLYHLFEDALGEMVRTANEGFRVINTHEIDNNLLISGPWTSLSVLVQKYIRSPDLLAHLSTAEHWIDQAIHAGRSDAIEAMLQYILTANKYVTREQLQAFLDKHVKADRSDNMMTPYLQELADSKAEGIAEGEARGEGKMYRNMFQTAQSLGLTSEQLERFKRHAVQEESIS